MNHNGFEKEYFEISQFYGDQRAKRSGVLLMNHIDEGIVLLHKMGASIPVLGAWCLHPIFQGNENFSKYYKKSAYFDPYVVMLAMEYRRAANAYLCKPETDDWKMHDIRREVGPLIHEMRLMLKADKIQNQKDFYVYQTGHIRWNQLEKYFVNWLTYLSTESLWM